MVRELHRDIAASIQCVLSDVSRSEQSRARVAAFGRRAADLLKADDPAFSYAWFFEACGLDNWGDLMSVTRIRR